MSPANQPAAKVCRMCQESIPATAQKCGKCGSDLRSWARRHVVVTALLTILGFFVLLGILGSLGDGGARSPAPSRQVDEMPIIVSATELYAAYEANEIAAEQQYKGKLLRVSGVVSSIGKDLLDAPYVALEVGSGFFSVQCMLNRVDADRAASLSKGMAITVMGRNSGKLGNVLLRDCRLEWTGS